MCPLVEGPRAKRRTVVASNRLRVAPSPGYAIKLFDHSGARKAQRRNQARTIAVVLINDRQRPEPSSVFEPIGDEVHRPALVGLLRYLQRATLLAGWFLPSLGPHLELQFTV